MEKSSEVMELEARVAGLERDLIEAAEANRGLLEGYGAAVQAKEAAEAYCDGQQYRSDYHTAGEMRRALEAQVGELKITQKALADALASCDSLRDRVGELEGEKASFVDLVNTYLRETHAGFQVGIGADMRFVVDNLYTLHTRLAKVEGAAREACSQMGCHGGPDEDTSCTEAFSDPDECCVMCRLRAALTPAGEEGQDG